MAPAGVPKAIVAKASQDIAEVLRDGRCQGPLRAAGRGARLVNSPSEFDQTIKADAERYSTLFKATNSSRIASDCITLPRSRRGGRNVNLLFGAVAQVAERLEMTCPPGKGMRAALLAPIAASALLGVAGSDRAISFEDTQFCQAVNQFVRAAAGDVRRNVDRSLHPQRWR